MGLGGGIILKPRKYKLYLDTSVIGCLFDDDRPHEQADTKKLWEEMMEGAYDVFISPVTMQEIQDCHEPKRTLLFQRLGQLQSTMLAETQEISHLAQEYVANGVLPLKCIDDCLHIAYAVCYGCDFVVSWNFRHLVNVRTSDRVRIINATKRYPEIRIISPAMLIERGDT